MAASVIAKMKSDKFDLKAHNLGDDSGGTPHLPLPKSRKDQNVATTPGLRQNIDIPENVATTLNSSEGRQTVLTNRLARTELPGNMLDLPKDLKNGLHNLG